MATKAIDAAGLEIKRATFADNDFDEDDVRKLMRGNPLLKIEAPSEVQVRAPVCVRGIRRFSEPSLFVCRPPAPTPAARAEGGEGRHREGDRGDT